MDSPCQKPYRYASRSSQVTGLRKNPDSSVDLSNGPSWKQFLPIQIDGRAPLDVEGMTGRMEEVLERALRRL
jgi:hypothetical protein